MSDQTKKVFEVNFDGLVSPVHNYSGLATGNLASARSVGTVSHPRQAAIEGLEKMQRLAERGVLQAFLPPQERPAIKVLRGLGFQGNDTEVLHDASTTDPLLFAACSSASSMWTANAATVTPSPDTPDGKVHITPANLQSQFHRSIEAPETARLLRSVFSSCDHFTHHPPLPSTPAFGDEGAANHTRLAPLHAASGLHIFVYGKMWQHDHQAPGRFPARQALEACQAIARRHGIADKHVVFLQQNPGAIDAGVFHNDVISVGNESVFLVHQDCFLDQDRAISEIRSTYESLYASQLHLIQVPRDRISLQEAVRTYLFNSQLVTLPGGGMLLLCPSECRDSGPVRDFIESEILPARNPISEVIYQNVRQSMKNGGGPACLRLRVPLGEEEIARLPPRVFFNEETGTFLRAWIDSHYPEELHPGELADAGQFHKNRKALDELYGFMGLPYSEDR